MSFKSYLSRLVLSAGLPETEALLPEMTKSKFGSVNEL